MIESENDSVVTEEEKKPEFSKDSVIEADGNLPEGEVAADVEKEATEIEVEKANEDATDVSTEEIIDNALKQEDIDKIDQEAKEYLEKQSKESEIDWDKIEFEDEEKMFPKVSKEEIDIFCAVSDGFIDRDSVETYLRIAHADIESYVEMKALVESGQATEEDKEYYDSLSKSKENSRMILAMIQQDGRKLDKEFKESRIAEDFLKAVTLKSCADYIVKKYRLNNSWRPSTDERSNINNTQVIRESLLKKMYIAPLFHHIIERDTIKSEVNPKFNMFGFKFYNDHLDDFTQSIRIYIRQGHLDFDKLTIEKVLDTDIKSFEFMRIPMVWAMKNFDTNIKTIKEWDMKSEDAEKISSRINPNNIFDNELKDLAESINKCIDVMMEPSVSNKAADIALAIILDDKFSNTMHITGSYNWFDCEKVMIDIAEHIPENVTTKNFKEWAQIFKYLQKYERYYLFYKLYETLKNPDLDNDHKRVDTFNVLCGLIDDYYKFMVGELITSMDGFLYEAGYNGETQNIMFSTIMSNLICQHELGFRQKLIIDGDDKNVSGEGLYNLAEDVLKDKFTYIIGNKKDDILLKDVDLVETRRTYITDCKEMIDLIAHDFIEIRDNFDSIRFGYKDIVKKPTKSKKSRRNRR